MNINNASWLHLFAKLKLAWLYNTTNTTTYPYDDYIFNHSTKYRFICYDISVM